MVGAWAQSNTKPPGRGEQLRTWSYSHSYSYSYTRIYDYSTVPLEMHIPGMFLSAKAASQSIQRSYFVVRSVTPARSRVVVRGVVVLPVP